MNQRTRELISTRKMSHKHSNKDLSRLITRYINSTRGTSSAFMSVDRIIYFTVGVNTDLNKWTLTLRSQMTWHDEWLLAYEEGRAETAAIPRGTETALQVHHFGGYSKRALNIYRHSFRILLLLVCRPDNWGH